MGGSDGLVVRAREAVQLAGADPARARALAGEVLRAAPDGLAAAEAERALGMAARRDQDIAAAVTHLSRSIRIAERAGARQTAGEVRISLALALAYRGRMATALAELDRAAGVLEGPVLARVELQRAAVWQLQGRVDAAIEAYDQAFPLLAQAGDLAALAVLHNNRGLVRSRRGLLAAAEADLRRAVELYGELGQVRDAAEAAQNVGLVAARRGDVVAALAAFDDVDRYFAGSGSTDAVGLLDRSEALLAARLLEEARVTAERALGELDRRDLRAYLAEIRLILAQIALLDGRLQEARELAEAAATAFGRQKRPVYRAWALATAVRAAWAAGDRTPGLLAESVRLAPRLEAAGWTTAALDARLVAGQIALSLGRRSLARRQLTPLADRRGRDPAEVRSRVLHARALLHLAAGDRRRADVALRAGMAAMERHRATMGGTELRVNASAQAADLARLGVRLALSAGDPGRVLRWAERWRAGALGLRPVRPPAEQDLAAGLAELRQVVHAQEDAEGDVLAGLLRRQATIERTVQRLARQARAADPYRVSQPAPAQVRRVLGDRALVEYVESEGELHAVVVTERRQSLHRLGPTSPVARSATMLRFWLRRVLHGFGSAASLAAAEESVRAEAERLDLLLLRPLAERLQGHPLVIAPTTVTHAVPWSLLPTSAGRSVSVAPSAAWWVRAAGGMSTAAAAPLARVVLAAGPDLPEGDGEVRDLGQLYPGALRLTGPGATVDAVAAALDGADLAHIAAHGRFRTDHPLLSSLRLADGPLTVYDLERLTRAPRLILLASCSAALSEIRPGDELMGLAAALLAQGTTAVIAPLFPVPDTATRPAMLALHRALGQDSSPPAALAAASAAPGDGPNRFTVAAFVCLGAG
ncbi:MAG TPA: CHAT domain-containing protein [Mycobacteriales bacterium]|nr:CHAT domain-containing protein [Mycobacteriales bacterium]